MSIVRIEKSENYSVIANQPINNEKLSWGARGMLAYLLSKPNNWQVRMADLENKSPAGTYAVRAIVKELEDNGYMQRTRTQDSEGKFTWITRVYEVPQPRQHPQNEEEKPSINLSTMDLSIDGKLPDIVNTDSLNTELKSAQAHISEEPKRIPTKKQGDFLDGMIAHAMKNQGKADISFLAEHLRPLAQAYLDIFGTTYAPQKSDYSFWRRTLNEWYERGYTAAQVRNAAQTHKDADLAVKSPASISYALLKAEQGNSAQTVVTSNGMYL